MHDDSTPAYRERLQEAASITRDLLARSRAPRWELFAKASMTRETEIRPGQGPSMVHTEETGVAVRTSRPGLSGFAAASGLESGASRRATEAALASEAESPVDPLPPPRLLGTVTTPPPPSLPARGWATHLCQELARSVASASKGRLRLLRAVVHEGSFSWILSTAEGFVACSDGTTGSLLAEVVPCEQDYGVWREWLRIPNPECFEPRRIADQISNRALLTTLPTAAVSGVRDIILHGEVTAHLVASLVPAFCASSHPDDPLLGLLSTSGELAAPGFTLVDDRLDPHAPVTGPCDGEGLPARRTLLVENGIPRHRLACYRDALLSGDTPRGSALRISYRDYPATGPANLRVTTNEAASPADLLQATDRALYCLRPVAPIDIDLHTDAYRILSSAVWIERGRVVGWQPIVELHGSIGVLLRRIDGVGSDLTWYQTDRGFVGAPTLLVRRQSVAG